MRRIRRKNRLAQKSKKLSSRIPRRIQLANIASVRGRKRRPLHRLPVRQNKRRLRRLRLPRQHRKGKRDTKRLVRRRHPRPKKLRHRRRRKQQRLGLRDTLRQEKKAGPTLLFRLMK